MSKYINHVRLTLEGHRSRPEGISMRWVPSPADEEADAPLTPCRLVEEAVAEAVDVLARAETAFLALLDVVGPGEHSLVCTTDTEDGLRIGRVHLLADGSDGVACDESEAIGFCATVASGFVPGSRGAVIVRTMGPGTGDSVRAWTVDAARRWLMPCTAEEVRDGYQASSTDESGPEPDLIYRPAESLPVELSL